MSHERNQNLEERIVELEDLVIRFEEATALAGSQEVVRGIGPRSAIGRFGARQVQEKKEADAAKKLAKKIKKQIPLFVEEPPTLLIQQNRIDPATGRRGPRRRLGLFGRAGLRIDLVTPPGSPTSVGNSAGGAGLTIPQI